LKVENIGIDDSFFDVGGHSLSAVQVAFQIQKKFKVNIPLQTFFDSPTIAGLVKKVENELVESATGDQIEKLLSEIENSTNPNGK
jgi:acyl carrier protein